MILKNMPEFKQDFRIVKDPNTIYVQFIYKGYEISAARDALYELIDVIVLSEPNSTEVVFRGLTIEQCIEWVNKNPKWIV